MSKVNVSVHIVVRNLGVGFLFFFLGSKTKTSVFLFFGIKKLNREKVSPVSLTCYSL